MRLIWLSSAALFFGIVGLSVFSGKIPSLVFSLYVAISIITFFIYQADKIAARKGTWRTPEATLHLLSLIGGWPGAIIAQQMLRHKSKKQPFRFIFWITIILNLCAYAWFYTPRAAEKILSSLHDLSGG